MALEQKNFQTCKVSVQPTDIFVKSYESLPKF